MPLVAVVVVVASEASVVSVDTVWEPDSGGAGWFLISVGLPEDEGIVAVEGRTTLHNVTKAATEFALETAKPPGFTDDLLWDEFPSVVDPDTDTGRKLATSDWWWLELIESTPPLVLGRSPLWLSVNLGENWVRRRSADIDSVALPDATSLLLKEIVVGDIPVVACGDGAVDCDG